MVKPRLWNILYVFAFPMRHWLDSACCNELIGCAMENMNAIGYLRRGIMSRELRSRPVVYVQR